MVAMEMEDMDMVDIVDREMVDMDMANIVDMVDMDVSDTTGRM